VATALLVVSPLLGMASQAHQVADPLMLALVAPVEVRPGAPVPFTLRLTNVTDQPVDAHFLGREITYDIVVAREDGTVVWRRLAGAVVPGILQVRTLKPHETLELRDVWRQRANDGSAVPPWSYTVWATLPSDSPQPRLTEAATLRIAR